MNTGNLLSLLAIVLYFVSLVLVVFRLRLNLSNNNTPLELQTSPETVAHDKPTDFVKENLYLLVWFIALVVHIAALHFPLITGQTLILNVVTASSYVMWLINSILFITTLKRPIEILAVIIIPITLATLITQIFTHAELNPIVDMKGGLGLHVLFSLLAYSILMLASFQALLLALQNKHLHGKLHNQQSSSLMQTLPALEDMELLLFRFIIIGVILLSIGLLSGFYFLDNLFGVNVAHKTLLSIIAWLIFSTLLYGRWKYGWRGKKAVNWTLAGFVFLMLAFFGTKIIQELLAS